MEKSEKEIPKRTNSKNKITMTVKRRYLMSKRFNAVTVIEKVTVIQYLFDDLSNDELQKHFDKSIKDKDYEYANAVASEAVSRDFKLNNKVLN